MIALIIAVGLAVYGLAGGLYLCVARAAAKGDELAAWAVEDRALDAHRRADR